MTYRDPERRTGQLARHLAGLGMARGERVTILPGNRTEATESLLAATQAGGIGVPLDAGSRGAEPARLLDDRGARVIVTDEAHPAHRPELLSRPGVTAVAAEGGESNGAASTGNTAREAASPGRRAASGGTRI
ncbi:AMP-binding protein [Streptomyces sp. DSM 110735]|uniref:AMP-binding protein n=1 Tax=Streptomyces sp. DSM 110735 TaxID=2775031 RepID=UPI0027DC1D04|nr:AMP-binding protein [Streptomyces sp. DSM 110735]